MNKGNGRGMAQGLGALGLMALGLTALGLVAGCGDDQDPDGAADLYGRLQSDGYRKWERAPGYESRRTSSAPHGDEVEIFVNDVVAEALAAAEPLKAWPEGSIIAKDGYEDGEATQLAAMEKRADGWFWAEWDADGESKYSGSPELCTDCHGSGDDFVRAFPLP
jgi:hypothetical protein